MARRIRTRQRTQNALRRRLAQLVAREGSKQAAAARLGITPGYIRDVEKDRGCPGLEVALRIADALKLSLDEVCGR